MNTDALEDRGRPARLVPELQVLHIQTKLHRWAVADPGRRFDDLYNLVYDPDVLAVAWHRVRANRGNRTAGVDGETAHSIEAGRGVDVFLADLRADLRARRFRPLPVRERLIPKPGGKRRRLGIPTVRDRVVQAAAKIVLEPIFEADFKPGSYGFRPGRRAQDAVAEIRHFNSNRIKYRWVLEGDIEACFDNIDHTALMGRVRRRVGDKRVLALIKAFLHAGILTETGANTGTKTGTPQGGILSPLLANIALSVLDDHFAQAWADFGTTYRRQRRRTTGLPIYRLVRYADDFVVMVDGTRQHAEALRAEVAQVLAPMGLRLSQDKTTITHMDQGIDFLGYRIQRHTKKGTTQRFTYIYPSKKALQALKTKIKTLTRGSTNLPLATILHRLNRLLRGWTTYFRHGTAAKTFGYLRAYTWLRVIRWLRHKHPKATWKQLRRRHLPNWWPTEGEVTLFHPEKVTPNRYLYRGNITTPWATTTTTNT